MLQFQSKSGINGTSLRAALHLFRFDLDLENAPRKPVTAICVCLVFARSSLAQTKRKLQSLETYLAIPSQYLYLIKKVAGFNSTFSGWF